MSEKLLGVWMQQPITNYDFETYAVISHITTHEPVSKVTNTGLLNQWGKPIYKKDETVPMGFHFTKALAH